MSREEPIHKRFTKDHIVPRHTSNNTLLHSLLISVLRSFGKLWLVMKCSHSSAGGSLSGSERNDEKGPLHVADSRWLTEVQQQFHLEGRPRDESIYTSRFCGFCKCT